MLKRVLVIEKNEGRARTVGFLLRHLGYVARSTDLPRCDHAEAVVQMAICGFAPDAVWTMPTRSTGPALVALLTRLRSVGGSAAVTVMVASGAAVAA